MGYSCWQNVENAYYGRKAPATVCRCGTRLYITGCSFYIQKMYKRLVSIMISIEFMAKERSNG
ncbi:hypothetical protein FYL58_16390 [Klebsiella aerogenes]|nr:hypothetical protein [Klebsiella aerogenes]EIW9499130.1 hypothetical protein [Klebsiella aerogenes]OWP46225.1 hypothetical protein CEG88_07440 [Klebsiella aerogenes]